MWELKEHNNSGAIIRIWQNHFIVAGFLTFWHALDPFIGNKKDSFISIVHDHDQCYSVSAPGDVWECEVRSKCCVLCWPHASTSAPWSQLRSGRESLQIRAKQSKAALAAPARPSQAERREAWSPRPLARLWITAEDSDWSTELYSASDWLIQVRPWLRRLRGSHQASHLSQHHPLSSGETHYNILYLPGGKFVFKHCWKAAWMRMRSEFTVHNSINCRIECRTVTKPNPRLGSWVAAQASTDIFQISDRPESLLSSWLDGLCYS